MVDLKIFSGRAKLLQLCHLFFMGNSLTDSDYFSIGIVKNTQLVINTHKSGERTEFVTQKYNNYVYREGE